MMLRNPNNPNANPHPTLEAFTTPLGPPPPPPPLSLSTSHGRSRQPNQNFPAYAGARHTLGPTFSEEEDGDDSEFIAEKMANLGLGKYGQGQGQGQDLGQGSQNEYDRRAHTPQSQSSGHSRSRRRNQNQHQNQHQIRNQYPSRNPPPPMRYANGNSRDQNVSPFDHTLRGGHPNFASPAQQAQEAAIRAFQEQAKQQLIQATMAQYLANSQSGRGPSQHDFQRLQQMQDFQHLQTPRYHSSPQAQSQSETHAQSRSHGQAETQAYVSPSDQRTQLSAHVHANLAARNRRQQAVPVSESEIRARFESIPDAGDALRSPFTTTARTETSPAVRLPSLPHLTRDPTWAFKDSRPTEAPPLAAQLPVQAKPTVPPAFGRFSHAPSQSASTGSSLSTLLGRRGQSQAPAQTALPVEEEPSSAEPNRTNTTAHTSPTALTDAGSEKAEPQTQIQTPYTQGQGSGTQSQSNLGLGRPKTAVSALTGAAHRPIRAWSSPAAPGLPQTPDSTVGPTPRSVSQPSAAIQPSRQPYGPPGNMETLKEENFKSLIRKRAGLKLGMLNRRVSPPTPATALPDIEDIVEE